MGYWVGSVVGDLEGKGLVWGDAPADVFDQAVDDVIKIFNEDVGRNPSKAELRKGLEFRLQILDELVEENPIGENNE